MNPNHDNPVDRDWDAHSDNPFAASQVEPRADSFLTRTGERLNPWFSIWTRPRATTRQIIDTNPARHVALLAVLAGIARALSQASMRNAGDIMPLGAILVMSVLLGPLGGIAGIYLGGWLMSVSGKWLGGVGPPAHVRAAMAWAQLPSIVDMLLLLPLIGLLGNEMFTSRTPRLDTDPTRFYILMGFGATSLVLLIWQFILSLKCIGEAHQFSAWRALGAVLLGGILVLAVVVIPLAIVIGVLTAL